MSVKASAASPQHSAGAAEQRRTRAFAAARRHTAWVRLFKFAIPVGSVAAAVVVALTSVFNPFSRLPGLKLGPVSMQGSKIAMESPKLTGFRKDKRPYEVTATTAYQDIRKPSILELVGIKATLVTDDAGTKAYLTSKTGVVDTSKDHLDLADTIEIWTEKGEKVFMRSASVEMKTGKVVSREPVTIKTPTLDLDAEGLDMSDNGKVMVFTGRVRTRLIPASSDTTARTAKTSPADVPPALRTTQQADASDR